MDTMIQTYEFSTGSKKIVLFLLLLQGRDRFTTISGLSAEYVTAGNVWNKLTIERIDSDAINSLEHMIEDYERRTGEHVSLGGFLFR